MKNPKRTHSAAFKAKVALEALSQLGTISEIASKYQVHPTQVTRWKKHLKENLPTVFSDADRHNGEVKERERLVEELYRQIGQQKVELDWLKKKSEQLSP